ncbi:MAG: tetratricopeptide repeat protein [Beijerinckiaceae bacterium]
MQILDRAMGSRLASCLPVLLALTLLAILVVIANPAVADDALKQRADAGNANAEYAVGLSLRQGTNPNFKAAVEWLEKAGEQGHAAAEEEAGMLYAMGGYGLERDDNKARFWYLKAANAGRALAQLNLMALYYHAPQDCDAARKWYIAGVHNADRTYRAQFHNFMSKLVSACGAFNVIDASGEPVTPADYQKAEEARTPPDGSFNELWLLILIPILPLLPIVYRIIKRLRSPKAGAPDPKKWSFDHETGEYHRVHSSSKDGQLIDPTPYDTRVLHLMLWKRNIMKMGTSLAILWSCAVVGYFLNQPDWERGTVIGALSYSTGSHPFIGFVMMLIGSVCGTVLAYVMVGQLLGLAAYDVGPPPRRFEDKPYGSDSPVSPTDPNEDDLAHHPQT